MRLFLMLLMLVLGAAVLAPMIMLIGLDKLPGDFTVEWNHIHYIVPVVYSLCASAGLGLLYYLLKQ